MIEKKNLKNYYYTKIVKSLKYLKYSFDRVSKLPLEISELSEQELVDWDGFATRFARSSDLFLSKYLKAAVKEDDPAFDGSFRDILNKSEKLNLIVGVDTWLEIRDLRNVVVREYSDSDLKIIFGKMIKYTPMLLDLERKLAKS